MSTARLYAYLQKGKEKVQLLLRAAPVEADATCIKQRTNQANSEKIVGQIKRTEFSWSWYTALYLVSVRLERREWRKFQAYRDRR
jgi:hypothetical protein